MQESVHLQCTKDYCMRLCISSQAVHIVSHRVLQTVHAAGNPTSESVPQPCVTMRGQKKVHFVCWQVYAGPLADGSRAVVLFNRHTAGTQYPLVNITVRWQDIGAHTPTYPFIYLECAPGCGACLKRFKFCVQCTC